MTYDVIANRGEHKTVDLDNTSGVISIHVNGGVCEVKATKPGSLGTVVVDAGYIIYDPDLVTIYDFVNNREIGLPGPCPRR